MSMKAILLVAGRGRRISEKINGVPKCILPLPDGVPVICRTVKMMLESEIKPVLCVGYEGEQIKRVLADCNVKYYENPFFSVTNNIASAWFCLPEFDGADDIMLLSGDLFYAKDVLDKAVDSKSGLSMFVDSERIYEGDYFFHRDRDGFVDQYGPEVPLELREFENVGIVKVSAALVPAFADKVRECIRKELYQTYFEEAVLAFSQEVREKINFIDIAGSFWREFDHLEEYQAILKHERDGRR